MVESSDPYTIRLPKPGTYCPRTGISRSGLNTLILPCAANNFDPPVESFVEHREGCSRGVRLIVWSSLKHYLEDLRENQQAERQRVDKPAPKADRKGGAQK